MTRITIYVIFFFILNLQAQQMKIYYFDSDQDTLNIKESDLLQNWLNEKKIKIKILQGYCDTTHHIKYNRDLALRRVKYIQKTLEKTDNLDLKELKFEIYGEEFPFDINPSLNRKVIIFYEEIPNQSSEIDLMVEEKPTPKIIEALQKEKKYHISLNEFETQLAESLVGTKISLYDLNFEFNSAKLVESSNQYLNILVHYLNHHPEIHIKILGHMCCNKNATVILSEKRARFIYQYLIQRNINKNRLSFQGMGVLEPIFKIPKSNLQQQKANRRVEIEIIKK